MYAHLTGRERRRKHSQHGLVMPQAPSPSSPHHQDLGYVHTRSACSRQTEPESLAGVCVPALQLSTAPAAPAGRAGHGVIKTYTQPHMPSSFFFRGSSSLNWITSSK